MLPSNGVDVDASPVLALFDQAVRQNPDAAAVSCDGHDLSYRELNNAAGALARRLAAHGAGPSHIVGIAVERSIDLIVAIVGVLKCGAAYLPLDTTLPEARLRLMLEDSGAGWLVSGGVFDAVALPAVVRVRPRADRDTETDPCPVGVQPASESLAYVMYTSGTTGRPKGVQVTHANVAWFLSAYRQAVDFGPTDVWAQFHACTFDVSVSEIFGCLTSGGRLVMVPGDTARTPAAFARLIDAEGVTILTQTPTAFIPLTGELTLSGVSLRSVSLAGERLDPSRLLSWFKRFPHQPRVVNLYGPTETTVFVTARTLTPADARDSKSPIGWPLPGVTIAIVDERGDPVGDGDAGELWVGGACVAQGYFNQPVLTAERFLPLPGGAPSAVMYRTGDRGRRAPNGDIEYLGRLDDQVKIRGHRVEPTGVAAVLRQQPGVKDAVVVAVEGDDGASLVGYVVPEHAAAFDEPALRAALAERLPAYMVCSRIIGIERLPRMSSGKLDARALPRPEERPAGGRAFVAPRTETEARVANLVSEVTGVSSVGAEDEFFELGGHSLSAMRLAARLGETFDQSISPALIFGTPKIVDLARAIDARQTAASAIAGPEFRTRADRTRLPLTFGQARVLVFHRLHPESTAYNFEARLRFDGGVDGHVLRRALAEVVARHEAYRTTFHTEGEESFQRVHDHGVVVLEEIDLTDFEPDDADARAEAIRAEHARRPFDIAALPLLEWRLCHLPQNRAVLFHREDHIVHDGWSFFIFVRDLLEYYSAIVEKRAASMPPVVQIGDYAEAHRRWIAGPGGNVERRYWQSRLQGAGSSPEIPTDAPRPMRVSYRGDSLRFDLPADLAAELRAFARREGVTFYTVLLAAFAALLARLSGADEITIGSGAAARRWPGLEHTVGMVINNLLFRTAPRADATVRAFLADVRAAVLGGLAHQDLPFEELVEAAGVSHSMRESPVARTFFTAYEGPMPDLRMPGATLEIELPMPNGAAKFDLNVVVLSLPAPGETRRGSAPRVQMVWEYATDLFDAASAERITRQYLTCLRSFLADPSQRLRDVSMSDGGEVQALMRAGSGERAAYPDTATIADLFEIRAQERGSSTAIRDGDRALTYRELDAVASRFASRLRARGVGLDDVVACVVPRGIDAIVALLAIAKADAAYLPLAPTDPPARLNRVLAHAGARYVIAPADVAARLAPSGIPVIDFGEVMADLGSAIETPARRSTSASLAAVLYTSGSTGDPKGVEVLHRGIARLLVGVDYVRLDAEQKVLQLAPLSFDASTFEIWSALLHGGELVIMAEDLPSASAIGAAIRRHGVTSMWLTASLFNAIIEEESDALSPLHQLIVGGERLSVPHIRRALAQLPRTKIVNGYGPTENTTFSTAYEIPGSFRGRTAVPIGRPIANSTAFVLDGRGELATAGAIGELHVGGDGLARGYRRDVAATSAAFLDHPRLGRLYRTGDLARVRADGQIDFRGRVDDQMKVRGFRIEPAEIEAALLRQPGVAQAAARLLPDAAGPTSLVAAVVPQRGANLSAEGLTSALASDLPPHLLPSRFVFASDLPRLASGKLDLDALARVAAQAARPSPAQAEAESAIEGLLCEAFAEALGVHRFAADEDFFKAGGHSLLAFRLLARLEALLGRAVAPSLLLRNPTPKLLARVLSEAEPATPRVSAQLLVPVSSGGRTLFFAPGGNGGDHALGVYARLALHMPGIAFVGFRAYGPDGRLAAGSVEGLAAQYVEALRGQQPDGPYDLAGGCIGGIIAFEMAKQLEAAGETIRSLTLLDTAYPTLWRRTRQYTRGWSSVVRRSLHDWLERHDKTLSPQARFDWYMRVSLRLPFDEAEASRHVPDEWIRFGNMLLRYRPGRVAAPATLLMSQEFIHSEIPDRWRAQTSGLRVEQLPGTHWTYIREHLAEVAAALRTVLDRADGPR